MIKKHRLKLLFMLLISILLLSIVINITNGSIHIKLIDIMKGFLGQREFTKIEYNILFKLRIPRVIAAVLFGGALSISGYLLQTFFKNPIVGPFILGISSGARLFVGFFMLTSFSLSFLQRNAFGMFLISFIGSMIAMGFILLFAKNTESVTMLIVIGTMVGYIASAGTNFLITFASENQIANLQNWSLGSFSGVTWDMIKVSSWIIIPSVLLVFFLSKPLEGYLLGENYARSMGINIRAFRIILILISSILSACVTAFAGPVSFIGIAVPHLTRLSTKTSNPKILTPAIFLLGGSFSLMADYIARTIFLPTELNISTVTSFIGAPIVIWLMLSRRNKI